MRQIKSFLYEQVARIGKAVASPKRLELIELLCQGEKTVEALATQAEISVKLASAHLKELRVALANLVAHGDDLEGIDRKAILKRAASGEVLVLDVRPADEYATAHLPHARSLPVDELKRRLAELPKDMPVVAYCRGQFYLMDHDAVVLLRKRGYSAFHLTD